VGFIAKIIGQLAALVGARFQTSAESDLIVAECVLLLSFDCSEASAAEPVGRFVLIVGCSWGFDGVFLSSVIASG
jgi:hypothetical protein